MAFPVRKILVTTDLSPDARRAYGPAAELARRLGARLELLHVVPDVLVSPLPDAPFVEPLHAPDLAARAEEARRSLETEAGRAEFRGLGVDVHVEVSSDVAGAVAERARSGGFDLVALSTHGRAGFRRLVMGSVAEAILRRSDVPVLSLPAPSSGR